MQQNFSTPQTPQSQVSVACSGAQTAGNANIAAVGWNDTNADIVSIGDSAGNAYRTAIPTFRGNGLSQAIYYAGNIQSGTNNIVTVTFSQPAAFVDLRVMEYSGLAATNALDAETSGTGVGTGADSGPLTVHATNELLFAAGMTADTFTGAGGGFTLRVITSPDSDIVEDRIAPATGGYNATASLNSSTAWLMQLAAFKPALPASPTLRVWLTPTNTVVVAWPGAAAAFTLQENSSLAATDWVNATNKADVASDEYQVTLLPSTNRQFFRLKYP